MSETAADSFVHLATGRPYICSIFLLSCSWRAVRVGTYCNELLDSTVGVIVALVPFSRGVLTSFSLSNSHEAGGAAQDRTFPLSLH